MKLTWATDAWYAWQDGNKALLSSLVLQNIGKPLSARIPSVKWGYESSANLEHIFTMIMLSNAWAVFRGETLIRSVAWKFDRDAGPPVVVPSVLPYRQFIIIKN